MPGSWGRDEEEEEEEPPKRTRTKYNYIVRRKTAKYEEKEEDKEEQEWSYPKERPDIVRLWLDRCNTDHGDHCRTTRQARENLNDVPLYLIDVRKGRIKAAKPEDRYVALSYVWEKPSVREGNLMLQQDNLQLLKRPGALLRNVHKIPATVQDASYLTMKLGLGYLWVDRLCIVQDDYAKKEHQISNMASVYGNAYLTIVAGAGDASEPLESKPSQRPRNRGQLPTRVALLNQSIWGTRGWTLQELLFSRRAVFFLENRMVWECHCDIWDEMEKSKDADICENRFMATSTGLQQSPWPDMDEYARIVANYSTRNLTYQEDTLPAILGVMNVLSESFMGGFVYGLPALFFDVGLLWRPKARIRRRNITDSTKTLPSWSWSGWSFNTAEIDLVLWRAASNYVHRTSHHKRGDTQQRFQSPYRTSVLPLLKWFLGPSGNSHQIENVGFQYEGLRHDTNASVPKGWNKTSGRFSHNCDPRTTFRYPVPIRDRESGELSPAPDYNSFGSLLHFQTQRAYFNIKYYCRKNPSKTPDDDIAIANILDDEGGWVGHFRSHDMKLGLQSENHKGQEKLEFIAISTGSEVGGSHVFDMKYFSRHMDSAHKVHFVNVLWIEWVDGVAYRRGLGHIVESAWDKKSTENVDIVLG